MGISFCHIEGHLANVPWLTPYSNCHSAGLEGPASRGTQWQAMCPEWRSPDTSTCFNLTVRVSDCVGSALTAVNVNTAAHGTACRSPGGLELRCGLVRGAASPGKLGWPVSLLLGVPSPLSAECASLLLPPLSLLSNAPIQKALGPIVLSTISLSTENSGWKQFCSEIVGHSFLSSEHLPLPAWLFRNLLF